MHDCPPPLHPLPSLLSLALLTSVRELYADWGVPSGYSVCVCSAIWTGAPYISDEDGQLVEAQREESCAGKGERQAHEGLGICLLFLRAPPLLHHPLMCAGVSSRTGIRACLACTYVAWVVSRRRMGRSTARTLTWSSSPALTWTAERIQMRRQALKAEVENLVEEERLLE